MANPLIHSKSSVKRWGGKVEDYIEIHDRDWETINIVAQVILLINVSLIFFNFINHIKFKTIYLINYMITNYVNNC